MYRAAQSFCGVEDITVNAAAAFTVDSGHIFRDDAEIAPVLLSNGIQYMPWGADNQMPYHILDMIERDETLSTCQMFNAEICYGNGLQYNVDACTADVRSSVDDFLLCNNLASYFLGVCQDFKHFGWCVSVIILDQEGKRIVSLHRKEVIYCRFSKANKDGVIEHVLYANWKKPVASIEDVEVIPLLSEVCPWYDLEARLKRGKVRSSSRTAANVGPSGVKSDVAGSRYGGPRKFAIVSRVPTPDSTYYPIPYYAALFRGKWYNIKQLIGMAKEAKLKNSAPIKYHIEVSQRYWENIFKRERITSQQKMQERVVKEKRNIIDFLTGAENSGKAWFSTFYLNPNGDVVHDVVITKIESAKEGGDWESDIQEAVNMMCFTIVKQNMLTASWMSVAQSPPSLSDSIRLMTTSCCSCPVGET